MGGCVLETVSGDMTTWVDGELFIIILISSEG
jgi:hypothetical protein